MTGPLGSREIWLVLQSDWSPGVTGLGRSGLLAGDPRVRTLVKVLASYPEVRYILPDRISLAAGSDPRLLEAIQRFLERQGWLVKSVAQR